MSEFPELAYEQCNARVLCNRCNSSKNNRYTPEDHDRVMSAIKAKKARLLRYYESQQ